MTVLSRGARVRRGGRRPGWVLLTALLVLAMGASSALVFTNRVELLKLAVILALWAAVAGAFVSVLYRRQSDADQSRVRDLKLVYDLQLDREISARREYELTVESQLRRELASELRAQAADDVAALRAELAALRTSLEILFDTDLEHRRALEKPQTLETDAAPARAYSDWARNGESTPVDWVSSDRVTAVRQDNPLGHTDGRTDEASIIDVPEVGVPPASGGPLMPPRQPAPPRERVRQPYEAPPPAPEPRFEPRHRTTAPATTAATTGTATAAANAAPTAGLAAGRGRWTVVAPRHAGQQLGGRRRFGKYSGCGAVGQLAARPAFQPGRTRGRPVRRSRTAAAVQRVRSPFAVAAFDGVPRLRRWGHTGHQDERAFAAATCPLRAAAAAAATTGTGATSRAGTPASQRGPRARRAGRIRQARPTNRWSVGRRPARAATGRTDRRWPASPP